jgi:hypothetical protein
MFDYITKPSKRTLLFFNGNVTLTELVIYTENIRRSSQKDYVQINQEINHVDISESK